MGVIDDVNRAQRTRLEETVDQWFKMVPCVFVTVTDGNCTVTVQGSPTAYAAVLLAGQQAVVGDTGYVLWHPGRTRMVAFRVDGAFNGPVQTIGPAAQTDILTTDTAVVTTASVPVINGRWYRLSAYFVANQISATGTPFVRAAIVGTGNGNPEFRFDTAGNSFSYAANAVVAGNFSMPWQATATESVTARIVARTTAGGIRFAANSSRVIFEPL